jgi:hypothetical protein
MYSKFLPTGKKLSEWSQPDKLININNYHGSKKESKEDHEEESDEEEEPRIVFVGKILRQMPGYFFIAIIRKNPRNRI